MPRARATTLITARPASKPASIACRKHIRRHCTRSIELRWNKLFHRKMRIIWILMRFTGSRLILNRTAFEMWTALGSVGMLHSLASCQMEQGFVDNSMLTTS